MSRFLLVPLHPALLFLLALTAPLLAGPAQDAGAVARINDAHVRQPGKNTEAILAKQMPPAAKSALQRVIDAKSGPELAAALLKCNPGRNYSFAEFRKALVAAAPDKKDAIAKVYRKP